MALLRSSHAKNAFVQILGEVRDRVVSPGGLQVEPAPVHIGRICGDAGAHSFVDRRTGAGNTFDGDASFETARLATTAAEEESAGGATGVEVRERRGFASAFLATAIL